MTAPYESVFTILANTWVDSESPDFTQRLNQVITLLAIAINQREIAQYYDVETSSGQLFFPNTTEPTELRSGLRKLVLSTGIAAAGTTSIAHGIASMGSYLVTRVYGTLFNNNTGAPVYVPIPQAFPDDVAITVDGTNVNIIANTATYNTWSAIVVLEYIVA